MSKYYVSVHISQILFACCVSLSHSLPPSLVLYTSLPLFVSLRRWKRLGNLENQKRPKVTVHLAQWKEIQPFQLVGRLRYSKIKHSTSLFPDHQNLPKYRPWIFNHTSTLTPTDGEVYVATTSDYHGSSPSVSRFLSNGRVDVSLEHPMRILEGSFEDPQASHIASLQMAEHSALTYIWRSQYHLSYPHSLSLFVLVPILEPTFIKSTAIPGEEKVYFFFTETSNEYHFMSKLIVSRVAQVCKVGACCLPSWVMWKCRFPN